jgi:hypothetical protein
MATKYVVIWADAHGDTVMFDEKDVDHKPYTFTSIGLLIRTDDVGVSLAREQGEDGRYRDHEFIPRAMVIDEWSDGLLKKPKKKLMKTKPAIESKPDPNLPTP